MWIKVDYSTEAKKNPRPNMSGPWAIYVKRYWWDDWRTLEAKKLAEYPKYFFKLNW